MNQPHFDIPGITNPLSPADGGVGALLARTADCLTALLQGPTATAGLNESRYNVLDALRRMPDGTSTQTELAARLLQSESNLSTLLERMRHDELISRVRSETDRRKSLIGLAPAGREALARADLARGRATAAIFKTLDEPQQAALSAGLGLLLQRLERELGVADSAGWCPDLWCRRLAGPPAGETPAPQLQQSRPPRLTAAMNSEHRPTRASSLFTDGLKP